MTQAQTGSRQPDWLAVIDTFEVQYLVLDCRGDRDLLEGVEADPQWRVDLRDGNSVLLARKGAAGQDRIAA